MKYVAYYNGDRPYCEGNLLIWLYDIHLLANSMEAGAWIRFARLVVEKEVRAICLDALQTTTGCFHTRIPGEVIEALSMQGKPEPSSVYLTGNKLKIALEEIKSIPDLRLKLVFLSENLFPPADYMRWKYGVTRNSWLPILYLHRLVMGVLKRMKG